MGSFGEGLVHGAMAVHQARQQKQQMELEQKRLKLQEQHQDLQNQILQNQLEHQKRAQNAMALLTQTQPETVQLQGPGEPQRGIASLLSPAEGPDRFLAERPAPFFQEGPQPTTMQMRPSLLQQALQSADLPEPAKALIHAAAVGGADPSTLATLLSHFKPEVPKLEQVDTGKEKKIVRVSPTKGKVEELATYPLEPKAEKVTNPVDQRVGVLSKGKYRTLQDALDAGQSTLAEQAEKDVRETRPVIISAATGREAEKIREGAPLPTTERSNLFDRQEFIRSGRLVPPKAGISKGEAARGDYVEITDQQKKDLRDLQASRGTNEILFGLADELVTAKTPWDAFKQGLRLHAGALTRTNTSAATYLADSEAFSSTTARSVGLERGVLTNADVARWQRALPTFFDTTQVKESKKRVFNAIFDLVEQGNRRIIAGEDVNDLQTDKRFQTKLKNLLSQADAVASQAESQKQDAMRLQKQGYPEAVIQGYMERKYGKQSH